MMGARTTPQHPDDWPHNETLRLASYTTKDAQRRLVEACTMVGGFAGTDGAIVLLTDLTVAGFGAEILPDCGRDVKVYDDRAVIAGSPNKHQRAELDIEQVGTRHRSAMRLCDVVPDAVVFVISQDGDVSFVCNDDGVVAVRRQICTTNLTMFGA